jgi:hypothetical protein
MQVPCDPAAFVVLGGHQFTRQVSEFFPLLPDRLLIHPPPGNVGRKSNCQSALGCLDGTEADLSGKFRPIFSPCFQIEVETHGTVLWVRELLPTVSGVKAS